MLIAVLRVVAPDVSFYPDENGIHMHLTFNQDSNQVDCRRMRNPVMDDWKDTVKTRVDSRGNHSPNQGGKTGGG